MKQNRLVSYIKLIILLFGVSFLLENCERDFEPHSLVQKTPSRFKIDMLSSKDVESNTTLLERLNKLNLKGKHSGTTFSREIYNSDLGFTINTDHIKRVEDIELGIVSYNFPLIRDSISTNNLENLLLQTNADGGYDAYIVEYGFTKEQYSSLTEEFLGTTTTKYTPIDFDASVFNENELSRTYYGAQYICVENWVVYWHTSPRDGSQIPEWVLESTSCYWIGGGGSGSEDGGDSGYSDLPNWNGDSTPDDSTQNSGGSGGTSNSGNTNTGQTSNPDSPVNNTPIISDPVGDDDEEFVDISEDECNTSDEDFNSYYSAFSPFNVDLSDVRKSCDSIDTTSVAENQKFMCVYNKLTQSPKFKELFVGVFGETKNINAKFEILDLGDSTGGSCGLNSYTMSSDGSIATANVTIKLNKRMFEPGNYYDIYNYSAILIARTIIHECLHAYLYIKKLECEVNVIDWEWLDNITFPELINEYYDGSCEPLQEQHQFIFNYVLPIMTEILGDVKDNLIPISNQNYVSSIDLYNPYDPNNTLTESHLFNWGEFFYYISLEGLHNTEAFESEITQSSEEHSIYLKYLEYSRNFSKNCE